MRKSDIEQSYHRGSSGLPMVNVKVYGRVTPSLIREVCAEEGYGAHAVVFLTHLYDADEWPEWTFEAACESGWEGLQDDASELFGPGVSVYSEGRSGGWAVVSGLPEVESWDAIAVSRWAKFAKWARGAADDIPAAMIRLALYNVYDQAEDATRTLLAYA